MLALALLVVPVVLVEEAAGRGALRDAATAVNWVIWAGFLVEMIVVLAVADARRAALRAHWLDVGIVLLTLPALPGALSTLRVARFVRLLRLVRLGMLGSRALRAESVLSSRHGFRYLALATGILVVVAGSAISVVDAGEFKSVWLGVWWAIVTVTTVGYGDYVPHTVAGRIVAVGLMLLGIGFVALLTATIASSFVAADAGRGDASSDSVQAEILEALRRLEARLDRLESALGR